MTLRRVVRMHARIARKGERAGRMTTPGDDIARIYIDSTRTICIMEVVDSV